jgi:hypothetical protein
VRSDDDYMESWLELWVPENPQDDPSDPATKKILLPGYGWLFGCGDGRRTSAWACSTPRRPSAGRLPDVMRRWVATLPADWTLRPRRP